MSLNKRLMSSAPPAFVASENFGVVLYEGDGASGHSINGGKFGASGYFTNAGVVTIPSSVIDTNEHSLSVWFNTGATSGTQTVFEFNSGNRIIFRAASTDSNKANFGGGGWFNHGISFNANTWYHLVITFKSGSPAKIYVNGSLEHTTGNISKAADGSANYLGANNSSGGNNLLGKIDQFRIFQKELSASQVSTLYAETAATVESLDPLNVDTTDTLQVLGDTSCLATYRFENDEVDLSGNYNGTGTAIQYAAGRYGQAASFNGSSSKITTSAKPLNNNTSISISFWAKNISVGDWSIIIGEGGNSSVAGYRVNVKNTNDGNMSLSRSAGNGTYVISDSYMYDFGADGSDWVHCVFTVSSSEMKYYKNGQNVLTQSVSNTSTVTSAYNLNIMFDEQYSKYVGGQLDQVRLFNKTISAAEVTTLYNENPLVASYRFEGNSNDDMRTYNGTDTNVTYEFGLNFTPDLVWIKGRDLGFNHVIYDSTRGAGKYILPNTTGAEGTIANGLTSFDTGGFTVGSESGHNYNGDGFVAWCFKANGGTTSSNTDGSITSTVQANQDAGFSIISYTGTGSAATVGHGLGVAPEMVIVKNRSSVKNWWVWHTGLGDGTKYLKLNGTDAVASVSSIWNSTVPTSTVFSVANDGGSNGSGENIIAYCFKSIDGFSKIGSYTGNGTTTGPMVETGFEPAMIIIKDASGTDNWALVDNKRATTNPRQTWLRPNLADAEFTNTVDSINFYSNGFQVAGGTSVSNFLNENGNTFIYMAFAADPDTEAPTVAKSFGIQTWSGDNSTTRTIDGYGFEPSLVWVKYRTGNYGHGHILYTNLLNTSSANSGLSSSSNGALNSYKLTQFTDDGFQFASPINAVNETNFTIVGWAWKADDNEPTINTEGSIDSLVSANVNSGFSIVKYEGNGTSGATIGHGLSAAPEMIIVKNISQAVDWAVYNASIGNANYLSLNNNWQSLSGASHWNSTSPTSTVFTVGNAGATNDSSGINYIAYCFHSVTEYQKFGSYTGTAGALTVTTGFQPDFLMVKNITSAGYSWYILDSVRGGSGGYINKFLAAESSQAETEVTNGDIDVTFTSTGFQYASTMSSTDGFNKSGDTYIYMAIKIN